MGKVRSPLHFIGISINRSILDLLLQRRELQFRLQKRVRSEEAHTRTRGPHKVRQGIITT